MRLHVFLSATVLSFVTAFTVFAQEQRKLVQEATGALRLSEHCFENLQAEWEEERSENGNIVYVSHRFWSREGAYYRLDSTFLRETSREGQPMNQRIIVRPEGFVRLTSSDGRPLTIVDFGSTGEGMSHLYPNLLFRANQRGLLADAKDLLQLLSNEASPYHIDDVRRTGNTVNVLVSITSNSTVYKYSYSIDTERGVCTGWEEIGERDGRVVSTNKVVKVYADSCVPSLIKVESETANERSFRTIRSISIDETAAPLGIFSLDAQGISQGSVWMRRLIMLGVGIAILGCIFLYRKMKKHA